MSTRQRRDRKQCPQQIVDEAFLRGYLSSSSVVTGTMQAARQLTGAVQYPSQTSNTEGVLCFYAANHNTP